MDESCSEVMKVSYRTRPRKEVQQQASRCYCPHQNASNKMSHGMSHGMSHRMSHGMSPNAA